MTCFKLDIKKIETFSIHLKFFEKLWEPAFIPLVVITQLLIEWFFLTKLTRPN